MNAFLYVLFSSIEIHLLKGGKILLSNFERKCKWYLKHEWFLVSKIDLNFKKLFLVVFNHHYYILVVYNQPRY